MPELDAIYPIPDEPAAAAPRSPFEAQSLRLLSQEERLEQAAVNLAREREQFAEQCIQKVRELERQARDLEALREQREKERLELQQEREELQRVWQARWESERKQFAEAEARLRNEQLAFENQRRQEQAELAAARRALAEETEKLREEQAAWRQQREREDARLRDWEQNLEQKQRTLWRIEQHWEEQRLHEEAAHRARLTELEGLERRLRSTRRKLIALQDESSELEERLSLAAAAGQPPTPPRVVLAPAWIERLWLPGFDGDPVEFLTRLGQDLLDLARQLEEQGQALGRVRSSWETEMQAVVQELEQRTLAVSQQEAALLPTKQRLEADAEALRTHAEELARREQQLRAGQARLSQQWQAFQSVRSRLLAQVKSRASVLRQRHEAMLHTQRCWEKRRCAELRQLQQARAETEAARQDHVRAHALFRSRLTGLALLHRQLLQRELAVTQAEQQLIFQHADPVAAEKTLARKKAMWQRLGTRPLREWDRRRMELDERARALDDLADRLEKKHRALERDRLALGRAQTLLEAEKLQLAAERGRWTNQVMSLQEDRRLLAEYVRELKEQLERAVDAIAGGPPAAPKEPIAA